MNNNKVVATVLAVVIGLFALSMVMRFVMLSTYGVSGSWMYFGLPFGGIGVVLLLLRLGLLNFGERSVRPIQTPPRPAPAAPGASVSQRLQQLDGMHASGAISDSEYTTKRQQIISSI
jgi:uncharacterized membrane protein